MTGADMNNRINLRRGVLVHFDPNSKNNQTKPQEVCNNSYYLYFVLGVLYPFHMTSYLNRCLTT
jgi:hypothetical protein